MKKMKKKKCALKMDRFSVLCPNAWNQSRLACKLHAFLNVDSLVHWPRLTENRKNNHSSHNWTQALIMLYSLGIASRTNRSKCYLDLLTILCANEWANAVRFIRSLSIADRRARAHTSIHTHHIKRYPIAWFVSFFFAVTCCSKNKEKFIEQWFNRFYIGLP